MGSFRSFETHLQKPIKQTIVTCIEPADANGKRFYSVHHKNSVAYRLSYRETIVTSQSQDIGVSSKLWIIRHHKVDYEYKVNGKWVCR